MSNHANKVNQREPTLHTLTATSVKCDSSYFFIVLASDSTLAWLLSRVRLEMVTLMDSMHTLSAKKNVEIMYKKVISFPVER